MAQMRFKSQSRLGFAHHWYLYIIISYYQWSQCSYTENEALYTKLNYCAAAVTIRNRDSV